MHLETLFISQGWRRRGLATVLGICAALALPPFYALPLLIPAFAGLFLLTCNAKNRLQAFSDGWWWGLGYFTTGLYWICISLWVEPEKFAWLTPVALFGLPSVLAIYIGTVAWLLYCIRDKWRVTRGKNLVVCFATLWAVAEYARTYLFTGFPWNLIGYVWTISDVTLQLASVGGIYGLGWIAVLAATMPALWLLQSEKGNAKIGTLYVLILLLAMVSFGVWRLETHPTQYTQTKVRIVQANVPQRIKWDPKEAEEGMDKHMRLTLSDGIESIQLVLWPETAVPYYVAPQSQLTRDLGGRLPKDALLITGGMRGNGYDGSQAWNSVFAIDANGKILAEYDKHHLVPFGEYIPLRNIPPVGAIAAMTGMGDFLRGPGPRTLDIAPYPPFSPLICYEAIFPAEATDGTGRAEWLLSLTDDAWFGYSSGPVQDAQMARVRAVEQGLPLLRAADTGISAAFDGYGRTIASLPLEKEGVLDLYLPMRGDGAILSRYPSVGILFIIVLAIVCLL